MTYNVFGGTLSLTQSSPFLALERHAELAGNFFPAESLSFLRHLLNNTSIISWHYVLFLTQLAELAV